jgi:flagellar secretion chaperone FliS
MATNPTATRAAYQRAAVLTASQEQLIVMLYDGANRFLSQAAIAMAERQVEDAHNRLRRAERIIQHLQASLDFERGGDLAARLASIFVFCQRHLNQARLQADPDKIEQVRGLLGTLRDAWAEIAAT